MEATMNRIEFAIMSEEDKSAYATIQGFIQALEEAKGSQRVPSEVEWERRLYHFMLKDPAKRLAEYQHARRDMDGNWYTKRETAQKLSWRID